MRRQRCLFAAIERWMTAVPRSVCHGVLPCARGGVCAVAGLSYTETEVLWARGLLRSVRSLRSREMMGGVVDADSTPCSEDSSSVLPVPRFALLR